MNKNAWNSVLMMLKSRTAKKRIRQGTVCLSALMVFCITYCLVLPAITMTKTHPSLRAEQTEAVSGEELAFKVTAEAESGEEERIIVLSAEGEGADLSPSYVFNEEGVCLITEEGGREIELHRSLRSRKSRGFLLPGASDQQEQPVVDYWFSLHSGETAVFTLELADSVDPDRFAKLVEEVKQTADQKEEEDAAGASDAAATASDAEKAGADKASPSSAAAEKKQSAKASASDAAAAETAAVEVHDDGFKELQDGNVVNDLPDAGLFPGEEEDRGEPRTKAALKLSAGFGGSYDAAVRDAEKNAEKRGDALLQFVWKEPEVILPELVTKVKGTVIAVLPAEGEVFPEGAWIDAYEILPGTPDYEQYLLRSESALREDSGNAETGLNSARFFDITIRDAGGGELKPEKPVKVVISGGTEDSGEDAVNVIHFGGDSQELIPEDELERSENGESLIFTAKSFSVYGLLFRNETAADQKMKLSAVPPRDYTIQITKFVVDESGHKIVSEELPDKPFQFSIWKNTDPDADADSVKDLNVGEFTETPDYTDYAQQGETAVLTPGTGGEGMINYREGLEPGLYCIKEEPAGITDQITDTSGQTWNYKHTYILTEYAWRNHHNDNYRHVSDTYTKHADGNYAPSDYMSVPEILGDHPDYYGTEGVSYTNDYLEFYVYNVYEAPKVDVPVLKTWADFEDGGYDWQAGFRLQWAPLYPGDLTPSEDFRDVTPQKTMTVTKADMEGVDQELIDRWLAGDPALSPEEISKVEKITFEDLPKYGTDGSGNTYRIQYSLEETWYRVTDASTGVIINSWDEQNGYSDPDEGTWYQAFYPHDAGEIPDDQPDQADAPSNYYISVTNALKNVREKEYISVTLDKQWDSSFPDRNESYWAEFELKRFVHTEYRDLSHMTDADRLADPVTLTVKVGSDTVDSIQAQPNVGLYLGGNFKPHDAEKTAVFRAEPAVTLGDGSTSDTITVTASGSNMSNALVRSREFFVTEDTVFTLQSGAEDLVAGQEARILDTAAGTSPLPDRSFSRLIRLDSGNGWHVDLQDLLRSETSAGDDDGNENVTLYEYYFTEKDSDPKGYAQYFRMQDGAATQILSGDADHQIEKDDHIAAVNGTPNRLIVKKRWRGVPDTTGFPSVTFTLYQTWADGNDGWIYENPDTHARYEHIELRGNTLEWICPEVLPATKLDGSISREVKYYVQEDVRNGSTTVDGITTGWQFYYYLTSKGQQYNAGHQGYFAALKGTDLAREGGTITICNKMDNYIQLDIQKQYFELKEAGSWDNITAHSDMKRNAVLGFRVIRAVKEANGKWLDPMGNESDAPVWTDYSEEMLCGYGENGQAVVMRGENDLFWLHDAGGDWHFRIEDNQGDANSISAGGSGLPGYGYYIKNGENIPVEYWYSYRETNVYKNLDRDPYPEWEWVSSITPMRAYGPKDGVIENAFPKAFHGQDGMRVVNFQASDLIIDKEWVGTPAASEIYVKIWRRAEGREPEDFTAVIAEDIRDNNNWQMYVADPSIIDLSRKCLVIRPDGGGNWTSAVKATRAVLGDLATSPYTYYIQEVGYRTENGEYRTNVNGKFKPQYDRWVDGHYTGSPVGMNSYADAGTRIGAKGENRLKVINREGPSASYTAVKEFGGRQSSTGGQSSVTGRYPTDGSKQVVLELQQRWRYEKTENRVDYVSDDGENWVRADSAEADGIWASEWQGAGSADPLNVVLPLDKPAGSVLSDEAWYGSADAWTYTWEGLDTEMPPQEGDGSGGAVRRQLYYRAMESDTPEWLMSVVSSVDQKGHKAEADDDSPAAGDKKAGNKVTNEREVCALRLDKEWTSLTGQAGAWPAGYVVTYQLVQNYHLALADMSGTETGDDGLTRIRPEYEPGPVFKKADMRTAEAEGVASDLVHPQAVSTIENASGINLTGLPEFGFLTASAADVAEAAEAGVELKEGTVYPVVYTYSAREIKVTKNGTEVGFKPQTVDAEKDESGADAHRYHAVLTNSLGNFTVRKVWNGMTAGSSESATIALFRFMKDPEPEPETAFDYTVTVTGETAALESESGSVTVIIRDPKGQQTATWTLRKENDWTHTFKLETGKTYSAEFTGDGTALNTDVSPSAAEGISETGSIGLTASVKPAPSGSVKLTVTGTPSGLWINPPKLYVNGGPQDPAVGSWNTGWFDQQGGEAGTIEGLTPGSRYCIQIARTPSEVTNADQVTSFDSCYIVFTATDGLTEITLHYEGSGGGGGEEPQTASFDSTSTTVSPGTISNQYGNLVYTKPLMVGTAYDYTLQVQGLGEGMLYQYQISIAGASYNNVTVLDYYAGTQGALHMDVTPTEPGPITISVTFGNTGRSKLMSARVPAMRGLAAAPLPAPAAFSWNNDPSGLPEGADPTTDEEVDTVTFSGGTWSKTWSDLPAFSGDGREYVYYAFEKACTGAEGAVSLETVYSVDADGAFVVTNTPTFPDSGNLKVKKELLYKGTPSNSTDVRNFTVGLFTDAAGTERAPGTGDQTITVSGGKGETTFAGLSAGTYYVFEIVNGTPVTESGSSVTISGTDYTVTYDPASEVDVSAGGTAEVTVRNDQAPFSLEILKRDRDHHEKMLDGAAFTKHRLIYDADTKVVSYEPDSEESVTTADGGKAEFKDLALGCYEIKETGAPNGYILSDASIFCIRVSADGIAMVIREDGKAPEEWQTAETSGLVTFTAQDKVFTATVDNEPGTALPNTGGAGTGMLYLSGLLLMILAGAGTMLLRNQNRY